MKNVTFVHNRHPEYRTTNKQETLKDLSENGKQIDLKPEQEAAIKSLVHGQDVLAILPTGVGKSAIYQILMGVKRCHKIVLGFW